MSRTRGSSWLSYIGVAIAVVCLAGVLSAQQPPYSLTYYSNPTNSLTELSRDSTFHIVNDGFQVTSLSPNGAPLNGTLCANIYVFNNDEQALACCGCPVTPDSEITLSLTKDLLANVINPFNATQQGVIKVISAPPNVAAPVLCDPSAEGGAITPTPELQAWADHVQLNLANLPETESMFAYATLSSFELEYAEKQCSAIHVSGSSYGVCTCGYGD
jgi:hypothetical protein